MTLFVTGKARNIEYVVVWGSNQASKQFYKVLLAEIDTGFI